MPDLTQQLAEGLVRASEWLVGPIEHAEAVRFLVAIHYAQGAANTSVERHALYRREHEPFVGSPYGVAMWMPPTRPAGEAVAGEDWRGVLALSRFALDPSVPKNGASFLLGRSMRLVPAGRWPVLLTFADTALGHTGAIYKATNWRCDGPVPAGDTWVHTVTGEQRGRKRGARNLSVAEMRAAGYERRPAAPKLRFVFDRRPVRTRELVAA